VHSFPILFLNQVSGPLFRELAEDVAREFGGAELLSGHVEGFARKPHESLRVIAAPDYDRRTLLRRAWSWLRYFFKAARLVFGDRSKRPLLFIVSNPPFLPALGWLASILRGQRYCVLVYDLYPGVLVRLGKLSPSGLPAILWRRFNRLVWNRASIVFTIGEHMAANIRREGSGLPNLHVIVIPNWADVDFIKPLPKEDNDFLRSLGWGPERTVVLYSGNLGNTHDLGALLDAAERVRDRADLGFLIIGAGARWASLGDQIKRRDLNNVRLLPFQPEALLPQTLPSGDIAVVAMESEIAGYMVPSKTYYYLAAGSALLALVPSCCEVADIVELERCGARVAPDQSEAVWRTLVDMVSDREALGEMQVRSRKLAVSKFSRKNTTLYIEALRSLIDGGSGKHV
jgi:glycosyltransferase involved in cell wall biosynthesis